MKKYLIQKLLSKNHALSLSALLRNGLLITLVASMTGMFTACQSAPETPPVIGKQESIEEKVVNNTQGINVLKGVSKTFKDTVTNDGITLKIDAALQLPQTDKIPVISVIPSGFNQNSVDKIVKVLMKGKQLYSLDSKMTKKELQEYYTLMQALRLNKHADNVINTSDGKSIEPIMGGMQQKAQGAIGLKEDAFNKILEESNGAIAQASDTFQGQPTTDKLITTSENDLVVDGTTYKGFHGQSLYVQADSGNGYNSNLRIASSDSDKSCNVQFVGHNIKSMYDYSELTGNARGMKMSFAEAKKLAQNTLNSIGATGLKITETQLATLIPLKASDDPNNMNQAYAFWFTRDVNGVSTTLDLSEARPKNDESYQYEKVFILIDDKGVIEFSWTSPLKVSKIVTSNAKIISFNKAMDIFKEQFFIHYAQNDSSKGDAIYNINRITLGMMRVQVKDRPNEYVMIPVWDFFGKETSKGGSSDHTYNSFLTINAIGGSIIDRTLGY